MTINIISNHVDDAIAQVIFAHGAGADMSHEFMEQMTRLLNGKKINVLRFNFPFMDKRQETGKRYPPDRMPKLLECYQELIAQYCREGDNQRLPLFIGGKSMGSRVAATLAAEEAYQKVISGVFCFGYPFHPAKKPEKLRLEPLQQTGKPILIVQGERDTLGNKTEISHYELSSLCDCVFLADGDHSLKPRVKSGFSYQGHMQSAATAVEAFILNHSIEQN